MSDTYRSISGPAYGFYREKGSKFYAYAYPVHSIEAIGTHLAELRKQYHDARHVCYAWRLGPGGEPWRANDDGEPSHSAGDPILNEIKSKELSDVLVAVVRYFGGTKLGVSGLIRAYGTAAKEALDEAKIREVVLRKKLEIRYAYGRTSEVNRVLHQFGLEAVASEYLEDCFQCFEVRERDYEKVREVFTEMGILNENEDHTDE